jgi:hypothetical protein
MINGPFLPWRGKNFWPRDEKAGFGYNIMGVGPVRSARFPFATSIQEPLIGDDPVFSLNYDLESNWSIVRRIGDDLKRIRPGLYLGDGNLRRHDGNYEPILYFALEL